MKLRKQLTFLVEGVVNMTSAEMLAYEKELEENPRSRSARLRVCEKL